MVHEAFQLMRKASASQAKQAAGHNEEQWRRFMIFTREAAQVLVNSHPDWTWALVPYPLKESTRIEVNARLVEEGIPEVEMDVFRWRMSHAMGSRRQGKANKSGTAEGTAVGEE